MKRIWACLLFLVTTGTALAGTLPEPNGRVILTVSGNIANTNADGEARFDREMLANLGWQTVETFTYWTEGRQVFAGIPLRGLLDMVGAEQGAQIAATALNDYTVTFPASDASDYDVLLALDLNGTPMRVRDKGPLWIIYPQKESEVADARNNEKMIWQLRSLRLE